jgi:hypothetical protein
MSEPTVLEIRDGANRDLLAEPEPLRVSVAGEPAGVVLRVRASSPVQLMLTADQGWLRPGQTALPLSGGESVELRLTVDGSGSGEFAVLELAWNAADGALAEHVLVQRQRVAAPKPAPVQAPPQKPAPGTSALPDWMR